MVTRQRTDELDRIFTIHGVSWPAYVAVREALDDIPGLRISYLEGMLELMSPSGRHEWIKTVFARLIEMYAFELRIPLNGLGSTTFRRQARERGLEPDECYYLGAERREWPEIAFEVCLRKDGIDKLAIYAGLEVPEVWLWIDDRIRIHRLVGAAYEPRARSEFLPDLDPDALLPYLETDDQTAAVRAFVESLA